jgi:hypothetical protein
MRFEYFNGEWQVDRGDGNGWVAVNSLESSLSPTEWATLAWVLAENLARGILNSDEFDPTDTGILQVIFGISDQDPSEGNTDGSWEAMVNQLIELGMTPTGAEVDEYGSLKVSFAQPTPEEEAEPVGIDFARARSVADAVNTLGMPYLAVVVPSGDFDIEGNPLFTIDVMEKQPEERTVEQLQAILDSLPESVSANKRVSVDENGKPVIVDEVEAEDWATEAEARAEAKRRGAGWTVYKLPSGRWTIEQQQATQYFSGSDAQANAEAEAKRRGSGWMAYQVGDNTWIVEEQQPSQAFTGANAQANAEAEAERRGEGWMAYQVGDGTWIVDQQQVRTPDEFFDQKIYDSLMSGTQEGLDEALAWRDIQNRPTVQERLDAALAYATAPGDYFTIMNMRRGEMAGLEPGQRVARAPFLEQAFQNYFSQPTFPGTGTGTMPAQLGGTEPATEQNQWQAIPNPQWQSIKAEIDRLSQMALGINDPEEKQIIRNQIAQLKSRLGRTNETIIRPISASALEPVTDEELQTQNTAAPEVTTLNPQAFPDTDMRSPNYQGTIQGFPVQNAFQSQPTRQLAGAPPQKYMENLYAGQPIGQPKAFQTISGGQLPPFPATPSMQNMTDLEIGQLQNQVQTLGFDWNQYVRDWQRAVGPSGAPFANTRRRVKPAFGGL